MCLCDLNVDQTLVKLIKKQPIGGVLTPFPVMAVPMTGQHVVTRLTPHCTSILMPCELFVQGLLTVENGDFRSERTQKSSFPVQGVMGVN